MRGYSEFFVFLSLAVCLGVALSKPETESQMLARLRLEQLERVESAFGTEFESVSEIEKRVEEMSNRGGEILDEFIKNSRNLEPYLKDQATEPFLSIIQDFINTKIDPRHKLERAIELGQIQLKRAKREFEESKKLHHWIKGEYDRESDDKRLLAMTEKNAKALIMSKDRVVEILKRVKRLEKVFKDKSDKVLHGSRKMNSYRYMLEIVTKSRAAILSGKSIFMDSFTAKDKVVYAFFRTGSLVEKAKLLVQEGKKRDLLQVDLKALSTLFSKIKALRSRLQTLETSSIKQVEQLKELVEKMERYEGFIRQVGEKNKRAPNTGYTKSQSHYQIILKLKKLVDQGDERVKSMKKESTQMLKSAIDAFTEMENLIRRKSQVKAKRKTPRAMDVRLKLQEMKDQQLTNQSTTLSSSSDSESDSDVQQIEPNRLSDVEQSDLSGVEMDEESSSTIVPDNPINSTESESEDSDNDSIVLPSTSTTTPLSTNNSTSIINSRSNSRINSKSESEDEPEVVVSRKKRQRRRTRRKLNQLQAQSQSQSSGSESESGESESESEGKYEPNERTFEVKRQRGPIGRVFSFLKTLGRGSEKREKELKSRIFELKKERERGEEVNPEEVKSEIDAELGKMNVTGNARNEAIKLVEMSYDLKNQFELVKNELELTLREGGVTLIRKVLVGALHLYLTEVCSSVLEVTGSYL